MGDVELKTLIDVFRSVDDDGSGFISLSAMLSAMDEMGWSNGMGKMELVCRGSGAMCVSGERIKYVQFLEFLFGRTPADSADSDEELPSMGKTATLDEEQPSFNLTMRSMTSRASILTFVEPVYLAAMEGLGGTEVIEQFHPRSAKMASKVKVDKAGLGQHKAYQQLTLDDMLTDAKRVLPIFRQTVHRWKEKLKEVHEISLRLIEAPLKGGKRVRIKALMKYGGDLSRITDLIRGTVVFENLEDMYTALELLFSNDMTEFNNSAVQIVEFTDKFQKPAASGYCDVQLGLRVAGHRCELQVTTDSFYKAKEEDGGHDKYLQTRERNEHLLLTAIQRQEVACRALLNDGGDLNLVGDKYGMRALHYAALIGNQSLVGSLLDANANSFVVNDMHETPVQLALTNLHVSVSNLLLKDMLEIPKPMSKDAMVQFAKTVAYANEISELAGEQKHSEIVEAGFAETLDLLNSCLEHFRGPRNESAYQLELEGSEQKILDVLHRSCAKGFQDHGMQRTADFGHICKVAEACAGTEAYNALISQAVRLLTIRCAAGQELTDVECGKFSFALQAPVRRARESVTSIDGQLEEGGCTASQKAELEEVRATLVEELMRIVDIACRAADSVISHTSELRIKIDFFFLHADFSRYAATLQKGKRKKEAIRDAKMWYSEARKLCASSPPSDDKRCSVENNYMVFLLTIFEQEGNKVDITEMDEVVTKYVSLLESEGYGVRYGSWANKFRALGQIAKEKLRALDG